MGLLENYSKRLKPTQQNPKLINKAISSGKKNKKKRDKDSNDP
jgi:hypothetical protein